MSFPKRSRRIPTHAHTIRLLGECVYNGGYNVTSEILSFLSPSHLPVQITPTRWKPAFKKIQISPFLCLSLSIPHSPTHDRSNNDPFMLPSKLLFALQTAYSLFFIGFNDGLSASV